LTVTRNEPVVGEESRIDENVFLGYPTMRKIKIRDLIIGSKTILRSGTVIYEGSRIGNSFETGHNIIVREENIIGNNVSVWSNSIIDYSCKIGNFVKIHSNVYIPQYTVIDDNVFIAPGTSFANDLHPGCDKFAECMRGPHICESVQIGVNVTILPKVTVGKHSLIGAGSVVTNDIPPNSLVMGNPAKVTGDVRDLSCKSGLKTKPYNF